MKQQHRQWVQAFHHPNRQQLKTFYADIYRNQDFVKVYEKCQGYTMTHVARQYGLYEACCYLSKNRIAGDIVECGVWQGGSSMICAYALQDQQDTNRHLWLYDTFAGMNEPTDRDIDMDGIAAKDSWESLNAEYYRPEKVGLKAVTANLLQTGYPSERLHFIQGPVESTIPQTLPEKIALLRLDTDWYESTRHELEHLYPRLVPGGVLIIDDYSTWQGARQAVNEYFQQHQPEPLFFRVDFSARFAVKVC